MKRVLTFIVAYNRKELLNEGIERLLAQTARDDMDILIVDNSTTSETKEYILEHIENGDVIYIDTEQKLSSAGGFQYGMRYAVEHGYEFVWFMDDDCMPTKTALEEFLKWDNKLDGNYGFLSSKVLWKDGSINRMALQKKNLFKKVNDFTENPIRVEIATFISIFIPRSVILNIGLSIKEFFIWTDDIEFTRRISRKFVCYVITTSIVVHKSANNICSNCAIDSIDRLYRYNYMYRNEMYVCRQEGVLGFCFKAMQLPMHIMRVLFKSRDNRLKRLSCIIKGTIDGLKFDPKIEFCN